MTKWRECGMANPGGIGRKVRSLCKNYRRSRVGTSMIKPTVWNINDSTFCERSVVVASLRGIVVLNIDISCDIASLGWVQRGPWEKSACSVIRKFDRGFEGYEQSSRRCPEYFSDQTTDYLVVCCLFLSPKSHYMCMCSLHQCCRHSEYIHLQ